MQVVVAEHHAVDLPIVRSARCESGVPASVVKSAGRALQILEFFDLIHREACVSEISASLRYPQSSTSVLLRSLVAMGYLRQDRVKRTYFPTRRVCLLGSWVDPSLVRHGALLAMADRLAAETGETVVLATINGLNAQYIYSRKSAGHVAAPANGSMLPLARVGVGYALLSVFDDAHVGKLLRRVNAERHHSDPPIDIPACMVELQLGRRRRWFTGPGAEPGELSVAVTADSNRDGHMLAVGIEGNEKQIEENAELLASALRTEIAKLGPLPRMVA